MKSRKIRVSIGSASVLGLENHRNFKISPTTCYLMTYIEGRCSANCGFCPQSRSSDSSTEKLSRISWPEYTIEEVVEKIINIPPEQQFKRACVQTLNYLDNFNDLVEIVLKLKKGFANPISVAVPPLEKAQLQQLKSIGVDRVGIALDGSTSDIFNKIKGKKVNGPYIWEEHLKALEIASEVFPKGNVSTHIIVGLGEKHEEILNFIEELHGKGILISLFAFTPIKGTKFESLESPNLIDYRKIQLGRYLIVSGLKTIKDFIFREDGSLIMINMSDNDLRRIIADGEAFMTSGCPGCNRPYYTSKPSGPTYNYPRILNNEEKDEIYDILRSLVKD
ncbi:MAG: radical SAM protein [Promethearchaeota archaeon]